MSWQSVVVILLGLAQLLVSQVIADADLLGIPVFWVRLLGIVSTGIVFLVNQLKAIGAAAPARGRRARPPPGPPHG